MRITSLHIDGFGVYCDQSFPTSGHSITVFHGPNEVGKSTVLEFIRMVLFGFPLRRPDQHYPPLTGGHHGGRMDILSDDGTPFTFERHRGPRGGTLNVRSNGKDIRDNAVIDNLRGHLTRSAFETILAFNLDHLKGLESADDGDITSRIYSAGTGATRLPGALKNLADRHKRIYTKSGRLQKIAAVLAQLTTLDAHLRDAESQSKEFRSATRRLDELGAAIDTTDQQQDEARRRRDECCRYKEAWPTWVTLQDTQTQLLRHSTQVGFPDDPLIRLDNLETQIEDSKNDLDQIKMKLSDATTNATRSIDNEALVEEVALCKSITDRRETYQNACRDLPTRQALLKKGQAAVAEHLQALGSDWTEKRVVSLDLSLTTRDAIDGWKERLNALRETLRAIDQELSRLDPVCQKAEQTLAHAQDKIDKDLTDDLDDKVALLNDARQRCRKYNKAKEKLETLEDFANADTSTSGRRFPMLGVVVVVAVLVVSFVFALPWYVPGGSLALLLLLLVWWRFGESPRNTSPVHNRIAAAHALADDTRKSYSNALKALDIGPNDVDGVDLAALEQIGDRLQEFRTAKTELEVQQKHRATWGDRRDQQQRDIDTAADAWSTWLTQHGLPGTFRVDTVPEFISKIEQVRNALKTVKVDRDRLYGIQKLVDEYGADVEAVATSKTISLDTSQSGVGVMADQIINLMAVVQAALQTREAMKDRASELTVDFKTAEGKVSRLKKRRNDLLNAGGTTSSEEFRVKAKEFIDYQQTVTKRDTLRATLRAGWMGRHADDELETKFLGTTIDEKNDEVTSLDSQLQELRDRRKTQLAEQANLTAKINRLSSDEEASQWRAEREELRQELRELTWQWSKLVVAQSLLEQARTKYEEERQPAVVRRASTWFARMSRDRYVNIHVEVGGDRDISVVDQAGRKKTPPQLSRGTRDQLYLALRFGLIQNIGEQGERLPVVVDEVLVNCDPARAKVVVDGFTELARTTQVLVLTCHPWVVDLFKAASQDVDVVEMAS